MPEPLATFGRFFWLIALALNAVNAAVLSWRSRTHIRRDPSLEPGYRKLIAGYFFFLSIPWIVMGIGMTVGEVPTVWHYFQPASGDPYVLAFFGSVFVLWILGTTWLFLLDGADFLVLHPGLMRPDIGSPLAIKVFWLISLAGGIAGVVLMWTQQAPLPGAR